MAKSRQNVNGPGWRIEWRKFSKEDARRDLAKFRVDRATDEQWVNALARSMDLGLWETYSPSQTPIAYDRDGYRINGKHRLAAFVKSKLPEMVFPTVVGLEPDEYLSFDQNVKPRKHNAAHPDRKNVYRDEARINWAEAIVTGATDVKVTTQVFDHLANGRWRKQLDWANEAVPLQGRQGKAPYVAALMYAHRVDPEFADRIGKSWSNGGAGLPSQLIRLRDGALARGRTGGDRKSRIGITLKMLNALAAMHQSKPLPDRLSEGLAGLRYFSERLRDGAAARWTQRSLLPAGEE